MLLEEGAICQDVRAGLNVNCVAGALSGDIREESGAVFASESVAGDGLDDARVDVARATIFFVELEEIQKGGFRSAMAAKLLCGKDCQSCLHSLRDLDLARSRAHETVECRTGGFR